jgi:LacI family transcriptional regulator
MTKPRLRDVAELARVDASVVSRVLSGDQGLSIREETRQRVLEAVARLDYQVNRAARSLVTARTLAIGAIVPSLANPSFARVIDGADATARSAGYLLLVCSGVAGTRLADLSGRVDGVLVHPAMPDTTNATDFGSMPAVLVGRREAWGRPSVVVDDRAGSELACGYLATLGHRRTAHLSGPQNVDPGTRRHQGYRDALVKAGLAEERQLVVQTSFDEVGGHLAMGQVLDLPAERRPTAVFASSDRIALGALAAAKQRGFRVPQEVSLVCFHDLPVASYLDPPLTTVRMPLDELGSRGMYKLLRLIDGEAADDEMISTPPELVVRGSTAPPPV